MSKRTRAKEVEKYRGFTVYRERVGDYYTIVRGCTLSFCSVEAFRAQIDSILDRTPVCH